MRVDPAPPVGGMLSALGPGIQGPATGPCGPWGTVHTTEHAQGAHLLPRARGHNSFPVFIQGH